MHLVVVWGHWIHIKDGRSANYQCIVPSTWNACPKTAANEHGAYEDSMIDTHVKLQINHLKS